MSARGVLPRRPPPAPPRAGVAGRADAEYGARPEAWIVLRSEAAFEPAILDAWCRTRLAGYKCPRAYHVVGALPRTPTGKLRRRALGAQPDADAVAGDPEAQAGG